MKTLVDFLMTNAGLVSAVLGILTTLVVGFFTTCNWKGWAKGLAAMAVAVVIGFIQAAMTGSLNLADAGQMVLVVFATSQAFYLAVLKPAGVNVWLLEHFGLTVPNVDLAKRLP